MCSCLDGASRATVIVTKPCYPCTFRHRPCRFAVLLALERSGRALGSAYQWDVPSYFAISVVAVSSVSSCGITNLSPG